MLTLAATVAMMMAGSVDRKSAFGTATAEPIISTQGGNGNGNGNGNGKGRQLLVNPSNLATAIAQVPGGVTLVLAPGDYGIVQIKGKTWKQPITLDARQARLNLRIYTSDGVRVVGGTYGNAQGKGADGYAIHVQLSQNVSFENPLMHDSIRALVFDRSSRLRVVGASMLRMKADGINIASSQRVVVTDSQCLGFAPTDGAHPDCIQMWSRPTTGITSDVTLLRNKSDGESQGFAGFNHVRNGVDDGGFDRIVIKDSYIRGSFPHGIALYDCRDCTVTDNTAVTMPTSKYKVSIAVVDCTNCVVANNVQGTKPGT